MIPTSTMPIVSAQHQVTVVIGDPVKHSLSPLIHNAAYAEKNLPFVMIAAEVNRKSFVDAYQGLRALGVTGCAVTMPHKQEALQIADEVDPIAQKIHAANTLVIQNEHCVAYNTDWLGILRPLQRRVSLKGLRALVIGAGGAAQAAVYALSSQGAEVRIYNRTFNTAHQLAQEFGCHAHDLLALPDAPAFDVLINASPIGMVGESSASIVPFLPVLAKGHIVFETIYAPLETPLVRAARDAGADVILGSEMFLEQALEQFLLHTGHSAPRGIMESVLSRALSR